MLLGVGLGEFMTLFAVTAAVLIASSYALRRRTLQRFIEEFRKGLRGTGEETPHDRTDRFRFNVDNDEICYQLLGVTPSASRKEIREAYRRKAKQHHPDKGGDPDMMRAITEAYKRVSKHR